MLGLTAGAGQARGQNPSGIHRTDLMVFITVAQQTVDISIYPYFCDSNLVKLEWPKFEGFKHLKI